MQRDFVIQLRPEADLHEGQFQGRLEHLVSGRSGQFRSLEDFVALIIRLEAAEEDLTTT